MKRPIIWFCLSFMAGIYCYAQAAKQILFCGVLFLLLCCGIAFWKKSIAYLVMILFFGLGAAGLRTQQTIIIDRPTDLHQTVASFEGVISDVGREGTNGQYSYQVSLTQLNNERTFLKLWMSTNEALPAGTAIRGTGLLSSSKVMKQETDGFGTYLVNEGYSLYCQNPKLSILPLSLWNKVRYAPLRLREKMMALLNGTLSSSWKGVLIAITTGNRSGVTSVQQSLFNQTGTSHILSVSGLHVSILLLSFLSFLTLLRIPFPANRWLCLPLPIFLALFMGGQAPVLRACMMGFLFLLADCLWTESDSVNSLFIAAFIILLFQPDQLFGASFLLSFTATLGILIFFPIIHEVTEKRVGQSQFLDLVSVSISSYLISIMVLLCFYHQLPAVSVLANIVVIPLFPILLASVFLFAGIAALFPALAPFGAALLDIMTELLFGPLEWLAKIPSFELATPNRFLIAAYCFLLVFCYFLFLRKKNFLILFSLVFCLTAGSIQQYRLSKYDSLTVINAGCIENILIKTEEGNTLLFAGVSDSNGSYFYDYQDFLNYFKKNNIRTIDVFCFMNYNKNTVALFRDLGQDRTIQQYLLKPGQDLSSHIQKIAEKNKVRKTDFSQPFAVALGADNHCELYPEGTLRWYHNQSLTVEISKNPSNKALLFGRPETGKLTVFGNTYSEQEQGTLSFLIKEGAVRLLLESTYEKGELQ